MNTTRAPMKEKYVRANNSPFWNKRLNKALMTRSRLKNKHLKFPSVFNKKMFKKHRNFCVNLLRREKKIYYDKLDINCFTDNKKFWEHVRPFFSYKSKSSKNITLIEGEDIISDDQNVANTLNKFFGNSISILGIKGYNAIPPNHPSLDIIFSVISKFKNHPNVMKIREHVLITNKFSFCSANNEIISDHINSLNISEPTNLNSIPAKILAMAKGICSSYLRDMFNNSLQTHSFPSELKLADTSPTHKKDETTKKENYRSISILPSISKLFEKIMHNQIENYMNKYLSDYLCGFRNGYSTQYFLIFMLQKLKKELDKPMIAGALLTDLSKAFGCLNHELLIAKLEAYGFDHASLIIIFNYLSGRKWN